MSEIKELMELGILIEPDALNSLNSLDKKDLSKVFLNAKEERPLMLTNEIIKRYLSNIELKVIKSLKVLDKFTVSDLTNSLNEKYNILKDVLLKKIELQNAVSINKASAGDVTIICIVKDIEQKDDKVLIGAEDPTGSMKCVIPKEVAKLSLDDVISVSGRVSGKMLFASDVSFPDVPIRSPNYSKSDIRVAFVSEFDEKTIIEADVIIVMKCESVDRVKDIYKNSLVYSLNDIGAPSIIDIGGINILILVDQDPHSVLKRRYITINNTNFLIDIVPDVVFVNKKINTNYKSISILGDNATINLKDREIKEINT